MVSLKRLEQIDKANELLILSATKNDINGIKKAFEQGANPNYKEEVNQNTVLHIASFLGHVEVVKYLLLVPGVDIDARNVWGETALHRAAISYNESNKESNNDRKCAEEVIKFLLEKGANKGALDIDGNRPCNFISKEMFSKIYELLHYSSKTIGNIVPASFGGPRKKPRTKPPCVEKGKLVR